MKQFLIRGLIMLFAGLVVLSTGLAEEPRSTWRIVAGVVFLVFAGIRFWQAASARNATPPPP